jgi:hypothetical protein
VEIKEKQMKRFIALTLVLLVTKVEAQYMKEVTVTPTVTASSAYTANDVVGGLMTFDKLGCRNGAGHIEAAKVVDTTNGGNAVTYQFFLYSQSVSGTITDKTAFNPNDASLVYEYPWFEILSTDCKARTSNSVCSLSGMKSRIISTDSDGDIYVAMRTTGTPTYGATTSVSVTLSVRCDVD